ncbi:MAG TPA: MBL fold metallo-hydrolase [Thermoanaerobaculia bacterium]|nr:MBL fold metallo-hydrolase [Thermoanaerobaculia bacterium]
MHRTRVGERVLIFTRGGDSLAESFGANATAVLGDDGILLVDPLIAPSEARAVAEALAEETSLPVKWVVLTHHHSDHALGAGWFAWRGTSVIAHHEAAARMAVEHPALIAERRARPDVGALFADADAYEPSVAIVDEEAIDLGGLEARLLPVGPAHTPGDVAVHIPSLDLLVAGDLVSSGYHVNYEDADIGGWRRALASLSSLAPGTVVPGHGAPGGGDLIANQLRYHDALERAVRDCAWEEKSRIETAAVLSALFPGYLLSVVLPESVSSWARFLGETIPE